jgi:hypothetical protein
MHFADDGIAGYPAQNAGDLARREPFGPEILELFDAVIGPIRLSHGVFLSGLPVLAGHKIS